MEEKNVEIGEKENGGERNVKMRCERDWGSIFFFSDSLHKTYNQVYALH